MMTATRSTPVNVLVVDDNPGKLVAMEAALSPLGLELVTARSGEEALARLLEHEFAAVLLDVNMPGIDGFEVARLIRGRPRSAHTPILFISAISQTDDHASFGYSLGAVDYIYAPVMPHVLRAKVSVFVDLFRKTEEARLQATRVAQRTRELEASHERLRLAERMAIIGTLSAGLGHDLGNLLMPIQMRLDSAESHDLPEAVKNDLAAIRHCTGYLQKLANGLRLLALDPSRKTSSGDTTDLSEWWADVAPLLQTSLPRGVALEHDMPEDIPHARIAKPALTQAVFNLTQNAGDVLRDREGGLVRVWVQVDEEKSTVQVGVTDNGPGMSPDVAARCLEPYFTTKARSISTGMGLALVQGVVQRAGGSVEVRSQVGAGTTFVLTLPTANRWRGVARGDGETTPVAAVTVGDARMSSYIRSVLHALGFEVSESPPAELDGHVLWILDDSDVNTEITPFLERDQRRYAVVVGERQEQIASDRLWCVAAKDGAESIRRTIFTAARSIVGGDSKQAALVETVRESSRIRPPVTA